MTILRSSVTVYFLLFAVIFTGIAGADTIYLKNGGKIKGKVIKDNGSTAVIDIGAGTVVQNKADIVRIKVEAEVLQPKEPQAPEAAEEKPAAPAPEAKKAKKGLFGMVEGVVDTAFSILKFDFLKKDK